MIRFQLNLLVFDTVFKTQSSYSQHVAFENYAVFYELKAFGADLKTIVIVLSEQGIHSKIENESCYS